MHYVICGGNREEAAGAIRRTGATPLADGEMLVLEGPWPLGDTQVGFLPSDTPPAAAEAAAGLSGFAVAGLAAPGDGGAFVVAAHRMLDAQGFRPYAESIHDMLQGFGVRSLARGGTVTPLAGAFAPDRGVVLEFASVSALLDFYASDVYAPLLALRLRTTDPRFAVIARSGAISRADRQRAEAFLAAHPR